MFLKTKDIIVNLENVSNINIIKNQRRIVFNMNYNIQINCGPHGEGKFISDYVYWNANSDKEFSDNLIKLNENDFFIREFIHKPKKDGYINVNEISSIKFIENRFRVIFNLSHPVTFADRDKNKKITSEFVYVDSDNDAEFEDYKEYIMVELGL